MSQNACTCLMELPLKAVSPVNFFTGRDSPVSAAWSHCRQDRRNHGGREIQQYTCWYQLPAACCAALAQALKCDRVPSQDGFRG